MDLDIPAFTKSEPTRFITDSKAKDAEHYQAGQSVALALTKTRRKLSAYPVYQTFKLQQQEGRPFWSNRSIAWKVNCVATGSPKG